MKSLPAGDANATAWLKARLIGLLNLVSCMMSCGLGVAGALS